MTTRKHKPANGELDVALGRRIRELRRAQARTQAQLGEVLGLSYQQVQKYENGSNRVSALMLIKVAEALGVTPTALLRAVEPEGSPPASLETERLVEAFSRIRSEATRAAVIHIVTLVGGAEDIAGA